LLDLLKDFQRKEKIHLKKKSFDELPVRERAVVDGTSELISSDFGVLSAII